MNKPIEFNCPVCGALVQVPNDNNYRQLTWWKCLNCLNEVKVPER